MVGRTLRTPRASKLKDLVKNDRARVLIVEDAADIRSNVAESLSDEFDMFEAGSLSEADSRLNQNEIDLILLDVGLPDGDGFKYCIQLREAVSTRHIPIIFLTAHVDIQDKLRGFATGGDDYITKPFHIEELRMRIRARLSRPASSKSARPIPRVGNLRLDSEQQRATLNDTIIETTPIEFKLLLYFSKNSRNTVSRENLIEFIWGKGTAIPERAIDTHLSNLRKKVTAWDHTILSVRGVGYKLAIKTRANSRFL